jgi:hypothetical protein
MHIIGRGRYAREAYPEVGQSSAAVGALRNRNVAGPTTLVGFTPQTNPSFDIVAALLYTPKVSGVVMATALLDLSNGASADTYAIGVAIATGTNLTVTGGAGTSDGWVIGSTVPPIVGGTGVALSQLLGTSTQFLAATDQGDLAVAAAISQPLQIGVPVVIEVMLSELGGGHALANLAFTSLSALELP